MPSPRTHELPLPWWDKRSADTYVANMHEQAPSPLAGEGKGEGENSTPNPSTPRTTTIPPNHPKPGPTNENKNRDPHPPPGHHRLLNPTPNQNPHLQTRWQQTMRTRHLHPRQQHHPAHQRRH